MENVAIIVINYNSIDDTLECVSSIKKSTVSVDIIMVDNASGNNEGERLKELCPDDTVILNSENLGFSGGNNVAIRYAMDKGYEYIILLNNDTVIDPGMIERLLAAASPSAIAAPAMYSFDCPERLWYYGGEVNRWTGNVVMNTKGDTGTEAKETLFATGCCMVVHRDIFKKVGGLDESFFLYFEDAEFCLRCLEKGMRFFLVPEAKLWHKVGGSSGGNWGAVNIYYTTRNRLDCIKQYGEYFHFSAYPISLLSRYVRMLQFRILRRPEWKAFKMGIRDHREGKSGKRDIIL